MIQPPEKERAAGLPPPPFINIGAAGESRHPSPKLIRVRRVRYPAHRAEKGEVRRFRCRFLITVCEGQQPAEEARIISTVKFPPRPFLTALQRRGKGSQVKVHDDWRRRVVKDLPRLIDRTLRIQQTARLRCRRR